MMLSRDDSSVPVQTIPLVVFRGKRVRFLRYRNLLEYSALSSYNLVLHHLFQEAPITGPMIY